MTTSSPARSRSRRHLTHDSDGRPLTATEAHTRRRYYDSPHARLGAVMAGPGPHSRAQRAELVALESDHPGYLARLAWGLRAPRTRSTRPKNLIRRPGVDGRWSALFIAALTDSKETT